MARAARASTARPPTTPPTMAPIGGFGVGVGVRVGGVRLDRLELLVVGLGLLVEVELVVVDIGPELDLAW
jgi:hypothetical protein